MTKLEEKIYDLLNDLTDSALVDMWNNYCEKNSYSEDYIYRMYDFDEYYKDTEPHQIASDIQGDSFDIDDQYFVVGIHGTKSYQYGLDAISAIDDLIGYIIDSRECFGNRDIEEVLNDAAYTDED